MFPAKILNQFANLTCGGYFGLWYISVQKDFNQSITTWHALHAQRILRVCRTALVSCINNAMAFEVLANG
jgi:hypothetical protein